MDDGRKETLGLDYICSSRRSVAHGNRTPTYIEKRGKRHYPVVSRLVNGNTVTTAFHLLGTLHHFAIVWFFVNVTPTAVTFHWRCESIEVIRGLGDTVQILRVLIPLRLLDLEGYLAGRGLNTSWNTGQYR